jgi:hypothetical protein
VLALLSCVSLFALHFTLTNSASVASAQPQPTASPGAPPASLTAPEILSNLSNTYQVTFVARQCPNYTDIMANRARNNIQESLRDLGKNTLYQDQQPIDPSIEASNNPIIRTAHRWWAGG